MEFQQEQQQEEEESMTVNSRNIFALMIAALCAASAAATTNNTNNKKKKKSYLRRPNSYHRLQLQLLNQLHLSLLSKIPNPNSSSLDLFIVTPQLTLPVAILSLIPVLLTSKCAEIVCKCAEFIGAALLFSLEMNEQLADDDETVKGLISALASSKRRSTSIAACNAVLDMSTTSIGRQRLLESSALDCLMSRKLHQHWFLYLLRNKEVNPDLE